MAASPTVIPTPRYREAPAAIARLADAFGFEEHRGVPGPQGTVAHAQLVFPGTDPWAPA
jgi:uncharacterized glyoxalase superfamily protein PhnB